ncbi:unnamed protein product [Trifolium pratense]|uniref:Uncharacterized protein n=1 Tax=Trifolium pratense TaxID=57577 RepID=A0ACB0LX73_TRIPR|nr:unnamed protein product [Trifolium pratense]
MEIHVVEGTISTNAKTITSSGPLVTSECKTTSELEGSTSEKTVAVAGTLSTISGTKNAPPIQLDITPKQKTFLLFCFFDFFQCRN